MTCCPTVRPCPHVGHRRNRARLSPLGHQCDVGAIFLSSNSEPHSAYGACSVDFRSIRRSSSLKPAETDDPQASVSVCDQPSLREIIENSPHA